MSWGLKRARVELGEPPASLLFSGPLSGPMAEQLPHEKLQAVPPLQHRDTHMHKIPGVLAQPWAGGHYPTSDSRQTLLRGTGDIWNLNNCSSKSIVKKIKNQGRLGGAVG